MLINRQMKVAYFSTYLAETWFLSSAKYKEKRTFPKLSLIGLLRLNTLVQSRMSLIHMTECPNINDMFCRIKLRVVRWMVRKLASFSIGTSNYPG